VTRRWIVPAAAAAIGVVVVVLSLPITLEPRIKRRLMDAISERFESRVDVESLTVSVLPRARIVGRRLVLHHKHRTDVPPLITIASFSAEASLFAFFGDPLRLSAVRLEGLEINVPPGGMDLPDRDEQHDNPGESPLVVADLVSEDAVLRLLRSTPGGQPRLFQIRHLTMQDVGANHPWPFRASLTNPTPPGEIVTHGTFGPWHAGRPARTPLAAEYRFENADLSVFKGIQGTLVSTGRFGGVLERIEVDGEATVPAFALAAVGTSVHLTAKFRSIVDGTSGDTRLQPVEARLIESPLVASGEIVERPGQDGRTVSMAIVMDDARVEDVLRLAVKGAQPGMTGGLTVSAAFVLPPGDRDVIEKLELDGTFGVATARFTTAAIQAKVDAFSTKARGIRDETPDPVVSNFRGRFAMKNGVIRFRNVAFSMPGTRVTLAGRYVMATEALDFRGTVHLDARLSAMTTGMKSLLVRLIDGLFRHNDITVIPITVGGTADAPKVRLDLGRVFKRG
jgi:hypothetical protein